MKRTDLIETSHGTVCPHCLLWPDVCTCNPNHPMRQILRACFEPSPAEHQRMGINTYGGAPCSPDVNW